MDILTLATKVLWPPTASSVAWLPTRRAHRTWPSSCTASLPRSRACTPIRQPLRRLMLAQYRDDLLLREPASLHRPSLQQGRILTLRGGKSQWQVRIGEGDSLRRFDLRSD
jgi:hypothetical protein